MEDLRISHPQIIQKLRRRRNARHKQMVARASACHVEQVALGVIDLLQVCVLQETQSF